MTAPLKPEELKAIALQPQLAQLEVVTETLRLMEGEVKEYRETHWTEQDDYYRTKLGMLKAHVAAADAALQAVLGLIPLSAREQPEQTYCMACLRRGVRRLALRFAYTVCPVCERTDQLATGVLRIIGQIGGQPVLSTGSRILYMSLWQEEARQLTTAEVDELEVTGGQQVSYDWALLRFLEHWQNTRPHSQLRIVFVGETAISANTMRVLSKANVQLMGPWRVVS